MGLPGPILTKIRDALLSAFPDQEETLRNEVLVGELNFNLSKYPSGQDYEGRVLNLLRKLDGQNRIIELIKAAYQENNGNLELKKIHKKISKISLLNILFPHQKQYFKQMKKCYDECSYNNFREWPPETVEEILDNLDNANQEQTEPSLMTQFVAKLLNIENFPNDISEPLREWGRENDYNLDEIFNQSSINSERIHKKIVILLILIKPSHQASENNRYLVNSWLIESEDLTSNSKSDTKYRHDATYKGKDDFSFEEIPSLLGYFIEQSIQELEKIPTTIEFFLPRELFNQPIDTFKKKELEEDDDDEDDDELYPIGMQYNVSIRSYQRIKKLLKKKYRDEKIIRWQNKWKTLHSQCENLCSSYLISGDKPEEIIGKLLLDNAFGVKLFQIPSEDVLKAIDQAGTPVALWLRTDSKNSEFISDFEAMFENCSITKIPMIITEKRRNSYGQKDHIGKNITLLWDNPNILPPELSELVPPELSH